MSYEKVNQAKELKIGLKQTIKSIEQNDIDEVLLAKDADPHIVTKIQRICQENQIPVTYVNSMRKLGKACGIDVGSATVALKM